MKHRIPAEATLLVALIAALCITEYGRGLIAKANAVSPDPPRIVYTHVKHVLPPAAADAVTRGLEYLASAQQADGGFGAGSHGAQDVRNALAVQTDPATTAFAAQAFLRAGSTLESGPYRNHLVRAHEYLLQAVESSSEDAASITNLRGTQPQSKLGQDVDVAFTAQILGRLLPMTEDDLHARTRAALDKCARKLARNQGSDGSWNSRGTWAGTLQSAMALSALESAQSAGLDGFEDAVERGRARQQRDLDPETNQVAAGSAAGVELYAIASAQHAAAPEARAAKEAVERARKSGELSMDASVSADNLEAIGFAREDAEQLSGAYRRNEAAMDMLSSDQVLQGFGSNGGEEFLSYMMTSESLLLTDRNAFNTWQQKMATRFSAIQNGNGSWSGYHCITSPVFCTAAVLLALTAEADAGLLSQAAG